MIKGWMSHYKIKPEISGDFDYYKIAFRSDKEGRELVGGGQKRWPENHPPQQVVLDLIRQDSTISRSDLSKRLKINESAVRKHLDALKTKGVIKRVGPDKGGHWEVTE